MNFRFKFGVLTAVSTQDQASEDKDSLNYQLTTARAYGERMGGSFTREYRAEGFSRSGYFDLSQALENSDAFSDLAFDARNHEFDVIIVESYDRLGDLGYMWFNYLAYIGTPYIQLRSVQQPLPIEDPAIYHPRHDDSTVMMINQSLTINRYRTSKIVRAFGVGNPKRAKDGKYAMRWGTGYVKQDKDTIIIDPVVGPLVSKFPGWFLSGCTVAEIQRRAEASGINPGTWTHRLVTYILESPFYAGKVYYDRKNGGDLYDGKHDPLWSWDTYVKIQEELTRRRSRPRAKKTDYNFTSLIECSECGDSLRIGYGSHAAAYKYWACTTNRHVTISVKNANKQVADELRRLYNEAQRSPRKKESITDLTKKALQQVAFERKRLDDAYYTHGAYSSAEFSSKKLALDKREADLMNERKQRDEAERRDKAKEQSWMYIGQILPRIDIVLATGEPTKVNFHLSNIVKMVARPDKTIRLERL